MRQEEKKKRKRKGMKIMGQEMEQWKMKITEGKGNNMKKEKEGKKWEIKIRKNSY